MSHVGQIVQDRVQQARYDATGLIGMIAFLVSWAMLFAGLFFAFGLARVRFDTWPPLSVPALPLGLPLVNTFVIAASSVSLMYGQRSIRRGHASQLTFGTAAAAVLGVIFVVLQFSLWSHMWAAGLRPSSGQYGSLFYMLTWVHAAHVAVGLFALLWLFVQAARGCYSPGRHQPVRLWALFWHFVGVAWLAMFVLVFLV